ncbi:glycosyltransferase family 2 protein [Marinobacter sp. 1Y8]
MKANQSLISIVTPTYNREAFLGEAIQSVIDQTYEHFELIIVDDGSTDESEALVQRYVQEDSRIRYFKQHNQGQSVARNRGVQESRGEFVCFLDSDNKWFPDKLEVSVKAFADNPSVDIVYGDNVTISETGAETSRSNMPRHSGRITGRLLADNFISMNTTMVRKHCFDKLGAFNERDRLAEDYELWLRLSTEFRFLYIPHYFGYYRVMDDQISTDKEARFSANERIVLAFLQQFPEALTRKEQRAGLCRFYLRKARYLSATGQLGRCFRSLGRAFVLDPFWIGPWRTSARILMDMRGKRAG